MQQAILDMCETGEPPRVGPAVVERLVHATKGLERALARREEALGAALVRDLFPDGAPKQVLPVDVRRALARKLETALHAWVTSPPHAPRADDVARPLRAIAESVRSGEGADELHDYLFPAGVPEELEATQLLRAFRLAAAREQRSLERLVSLVPAFEAWDALIQHEIAGRAVLVVRLWVVSVRWYALAAGRMGVAQARAFQALVEKWTRIEREMRLVIEA